MGNLLFDISLSKEDNLLRRFEEIHDYIYANDGLSPQQALEEFVKILFVKIFGENEHLNLFSEQNIFELFEKTKQNFSEIFENDEKIKLSENSIKFIVSKLQDISLVSSSQDAKGLAFQKFLSHHEKDRQGQFFTPEPVIDFCVEMMQPKPNDKIIDPACGSGGFLMSALKYLQKNNQNTDIQDIISKNIFGFDINKSILRIAKMKLLLEANVKTNVLCANSLENFDHLNNTFDLILANPPFGAKITNSEILTKFDLGYKWTKHENEFYKTKNLQSTQNTEILFIERCLQLLKEGGRMGIVLPNGNFENPSLEYLRFFIKQKSKLLAVVKLPQETFIPFGTGVKTSIMFLEKYTQNIEKQYSVFFGKITKLGYQGNKNGTPIYKKDKCGQILKTNHQAILPSRASYEIKEGDIITAIAGNSVGTKKIEIYVPFDGESELISNQIKKAFALKQEFKNQLANIMLEIV